MSRNSNCEGYAAAQCTGWNEIERGHAKNVLGYTLKCASSETQYLIYAAALLQNLVGECPYSSLKLNSSGQFYRSVFITLPKSPSRGKTPKNCKDVYKTQNQGIEWL